MTLGFRTQWGKPPRPTQFEEKILDGRKKHTLREDLKNRWKAGLTIQFVTGNRTKQRKLFLEGECTGTQMVYMTIDGKEFMMKVGDTLLDNSQIRRFAQNDGFDSLDDFIAWFRPLIEADAHKLLTLKLIHWTDFRYGRPDPRYY